MDSAPPIVDKLADQNEEGKALRNFHPTRSQIRVWGTKSALSLVDQAFTSLAGFGVNVLLARWMLADQYGAFVVAFAGYLFLSGFHNVLLLEPLSVIGPARHASDLRHYFRIQLHVHGVLVWPLSAAILLAAGVLFRVTPNSPLIGALVGGGVALPFLLLLWLARRMCYVLQQPSTAVIGSGLYFFFAIGSLILLRYTGRVNSLNAFLLTGLGSLLGAIAIFRQVHINKMQAEDEISISWQSVLAENWIYGRWLVGSAILYAVSTYTQTFFVAAALGLGAAGILKAAQIPSLVMTQVIMATGLLVLPSMSYDFGKGRTANLRHKAMLVSIGLGLLAIGFAACLALGDKRVDQLLFKGKYASDAWLIPVLALIPVVNGASMGYSMALRASQKSHLDLISNACAAPVAVFSTAFFIRWWGLGGAAISMLLCFVVLSTANVFFFVRSEKSRYFPGSDEAYGDSETVKGSRAFKL